MGGSAEPPSLEANETIWAAVTESAEYSKQKNVEGWMGIMRIIKKMIQAVFLHLPMRNILIFESSPDFACNTYPVFLRMQKELPEYKMVWAVGGDTKLTGKRKNTFFLYECGMRNRIKFHYYHYFAKAMISSNRVLEKKRPEQVNLFLCHGSKTKRTRGSYEVGQDVDYVNVQSHFFDDIITYEYNCTKEKLVYLGYPRCDWLYQSQVQKQAHKRALFHRDDCALVVWLPTFRKHASAQAEHQMDTRSYDCIGMPLVHSKQQLDGLDRFLGQRNLYLLYKPHPAQDISGLKAASLSHILVLTDEHLAQMELQLYELLGASDAMITDYSSVFFDYLLTDRPIATTTDDIDAWKRMTGFAFDLDAFLDQATTRVADIRELEAFLENVTNGKDDKSEGRKRVRETTNTYFDDRSAQRVADFVMEKIGERESHW